MSSIVSSLVHFAASQGDAPAYIDDRHHITYAHLLRRVQNAAGWLAHEGIRAGDTVALTLYSTPAGSLWSLQVLYAAAWLGAVVLPIFPGIPPSARNMLLTRFHARWLICAGEPATVGTTKSIDPNRYDAGGEKWLDVLPARGDGADGAFLYVLTSGTTGIPKALLFTHAQFPQCLLSTTAPLGTTAADRQIASLRWPSVPALRALVRIHSAGAAFVNAGFPDTWQSLAALVSEFGLTQIAASPWQLRRLLHNPRPAGFQMPPVRSLHITGAFISPAEMRAIKAWLSPNVYVAYAASEMGTISLLLPQDSPDIVGGVGRLLPGLEAFAMDEHDRPLPPGGIGNLAVRAPGTPQAYEDNPEATRRRFRGGWFYPGDVGSVDAGGFITLHGRGDDVINYGGVKIWPEPIEAVLKEHPDVLDAAVAGVPDAMAGQLPTAFVVLRSAVSREQLDAFCRARIEALSMPVNFTVVDEIPRNEQGKVLRTRLVTMT